MVQENKEKISYAYIYQRILIDIQKIGDKISIIPMSNPIHNTSHVLPRDDNTTLVHKPQYQTFSIKNPITHKGIRY